MTLLQLDQTDQALKLSEDFLAREESQGLAHRLVADIKRYRGQEQAAQEILVRGLERYPRQFYLIEAQCFLPCNQAIRGSKGNSGECSKSRLSIPISVFRSTHHSLSTA